MIAGGPKERQDSTGESVPFLVVLSTERVWANLTFSEDDPSAGYRVRGDGNVDRFLFSGM